MKKNLLLIISLICLFITIPVHGEVKTFERTTENNYGVNKKWQITERNLNNVKNTKLVDASEKIYDFAGILDDDTITNLKVNIDAFIAKTNMDMVILTINEPYSYDSLNEEIAADFYDYNDFGIDFKNYSGILLLRNAYINDPYYDIYTFGEAQLYFNYSRLNSVLDDIYDELHSGSYLNGMNRFINEISAYYDRGIPSEYRDAYITETGEIKFHRYYHAPYNIAIIIAIVVMIIVLVVLCKKNKMVKKALEANEYMNGDINYNRKDVKLVNSIVTHHVISHDTGGSSGGGSHGSFGSSGGFHSSGGGRHG